MAQTCATAASSGQVEATAQVMAPLDPRWPLPCTRLCATLVSTCGWAPRSRPWVRSDVTLSDGTELPADLVVAAIGVHPDATLARAAGLRVGERGGVVVDEQFRTSDPHIYAVGDAVEKVDE